MVLTLAVCALTIPAAYFQGHVLQRWGDDHDLQREVLALQEIPTQLGQWRFVEDGVPLAASAQAKLQVRGYCHRIYEHPVTGQRVALVLLVGPAGPLVRHPPEICYQTCANRLLASEPLRIDAGGQVAELRRLRYQSAGAVDGDFVVAYGFGCHGVWACPVSPRMSYAGQSALYKLHVLSDMTGESALTGLTDFLQQLLPALNQDTRRAASQVLELSLTYRPV